MKGIFALLVLVILIIFGLLYATKEAVLDNQIPAASSTITFPQGGEELVAGEVYTLAWTGGIDPIHIFLIDTSIKEQGASVSVMDRVYGVKNEHAYNYTIPETIRPGEYQFQIGDQMSGVFRVVASSSKSF